MILARRPLRFLVILLGGWSAARIAILWPAVADGSDVAHAIATIPHRPAVDSKPSLVVQAVPPPVGARRAMLSRAMSRPADREEATVAFSIAARPERYEARGASNGPVTATTASPPLATALSRPRVAGRSRLAVSVWAIARAGGTAAVFAPQLGGSQAGVRATYALGAARRLAVAARLATPIGRGQREAAVGLDWQPLALPVHLFAEHRFVLGRGRGGPTAGVIAGLNPTRIAGNFRLEGYGQAGLIARRGGEGFADGALRVGMPVAHVGAATLDLGAGAWGAAQRGARRIDAGPSVTVIAPVAGKAVRVSLEWRQRIAGNARPASGPALSIGGDF